MRKLSESIWSDIQDRSAGETIRKEDDIDLLDFEGFYKHIENRYKNYGMYASSDIKFTNVGIERVKSIIIYYPNEMIIFPGKKYPLVIMVNGTGVEYQKYEPTLKHLSSWGFIVAGNDVLQQH